MAIGSLIFGGSETLGNKLATKTGTVEVTPSMIDEVLKENAPLVENNPALKQTLQTLSDNGTGFKLDIKRPAGGLRQTIGEVLGGQAERSATPTIGEATPKLETYANPNVKPPQLEAPTEQYANPGVSKNLALAEQAKPIIKPLGNGQNVEIRPIQLDKGISGLAYRTDPFSQFKISKETNPDSLIKTLQAPTTPQTAPETTQPMKSLGGKTGTLQTIPIKDVTIEEQGPVSQTPSQTKAPVEVIQDTQTGKYHLFDGGHRLQEAIARGETSISALVAKGEPVKGGGWDVPSKPQTAITPKVDPLALEAQKYKSAEEFVKAIQANPEKIPTTPEYQKYLKENDAFVKQENSLYAQMKAMRDTYAGKTIKDVPASDITKYENLQKELSQTLSKKTMAKSPEGVIKTHIGDKALQSQLTDFYNQATKPVETPTAELNGAKNALANNQTGIKPGGVERAK